MPQRTIRKRCQIMSTWILHLHLYSIDFEMKVSRNGLDQELLGFKHAKINYSNNSPSQLLYDSTLLFEKDLSSRCTSCASLRIDSRRCLIPPVPSTISALGSFSKTLCRHCAHFSRLYRGMIYYAALRTALSLLR